MFSYLRYFALLSLLLVIIGAIALSTYFKEMKQRELVESTTRLVNTSLQGFGETIWARYEPSIVAGRFDVLSALQIEAKQFFASQPFTKVSIVSPDIRSTYFGSSAVVITDSDRRTVTLFDLDKVQRGQIVARLVKDATLSGNNSEHVMVQAIVPLLSRALSEAELAKCDATTPKCRPHAVVEIYVDITPEWRQLRFMQFMIISTMIGIFTLLIGMLLFTSWRAESIISRQHEVNLELTAAAASAEAQSRDKSQFLASISHELRTPLNAIIGFSDIIRNEARSQLEKVYQDYIDDIHASGRHLLSLINDILDYSKAEAGKLQIEWGETDAAKIIRNSLRMVLPRAETAQVTLVEDIPINHLVVVTDAKKLKQVLLNLLSNAVKFTPAGGAVRCHAWEDVFKQQLVIQVRDTGIGIAPKDISKVMTPFGQVDSALSRKYEGTGLGLPLSKKFIEAMGGTFLIESELNIGTTITVSIPKQPKDWQANEAPASNDEPAHVEAS